MADFTQAHPGIARRKEYYNVKWGRIGEGQIPMFIADMDFPTPEPIMAALRERLEHPFFGYSYISDTLLPVIQTHYQDKFGARVEREWIVIVPSVMPGVHAAALMAGGGVMYCEPMYSNIRHVAGTIGAPLTTAGMSREGGRWHFDLAAMEKALTPETGSFILSSPANPTGRVFTPEELREVAAFCREHGLVPISDEIHCELTLEGKHTPFFTVEPRSVTLSAAGKICNIPGLPAAFAIIPDEELRNAFRKASRGLFPWGANNLSAVALKAALDGSCDAWKEELRAALRKNRDYVEARIAAMPPLSVTHNEATYLAWIDCAGLPVEDPQKLFADYGVVLTGGADFGDQRCVRLNYGCPPDQLREALDRMEKAVKETVK